MTADERGRQRRSGRTPSATYQRQYASVVSLAAALFNGFFERPAGSLHFKGQEAHTVLGVRFDGCWKTHLGQV